MLSAENAFSDWIACTAKRSLCRRERQRQRALLLGGQNLGKGKPRLAPNRLRPIANLPLGDRTSCFSAAGEVVLEVMASTAAVALAETDLSEGRLTKTDLKKGNLSMVQCLQGQMLTRCWDLLKSLESLKFLESLKVSLANSSLYESRLTADLLQSGNSGWNRLCIKIASKSK